MQTFLPYEDFEKCAKVLDDKRLYKQIVECKQILQTLKKIEYRKHHYKNGDEYNKIPWGNHPAVLMWKGFEAALRDYQEAMLNEWVCRRWNEDGLNDLYVSSGYAEFGKIPDWMGNERLHKSHRAMLFWKNAEYYKDFKFDYIEEIERIGKENSLDINLCVFPKPEYYWSVKKGEE